MNKEKQIEEMAKDIADVWIVDLDGDVHLLSERLWSDDIYNIANELHNAGYRKASEVAREIFEEIDKLAYRFMNDRHYIFGDMVYDLAELKKKYTEERE